MKEEFVKELIEKYKIDVEDLRREQEKLAKKIDLVDTVDFSEINHIAGIDCAFSGNQIICGIVLLDENLEILEKVFFKDKIRFPYISEFKSYRELPAVSSAFEKLEIKPDLVFIRGEGILHPREIGIATHFSILTGIPTIGILDKLSYGEIKEENVLLNGKIAGKVLNSKKGSNPLYVSPGNLISLKTAFELSEKFLKFPHKLPEPIYLAHRYAKKISKEL